MSYQLTDNGKSIRFLHTSSSKELLLLKSSVKQICVLRDDLIQIRIGHDLADLFFHHSDVTLPVTASAGVLVQQINDWIT
jgi:hypothetical protein